jgi:WD40 repeat protein/serine/threonine protein kinase
MTAGLPDEDSLPLSVELRIDAVCQRFEAAWQAIEHGGARPVIEAYMDAAAEPEPAALLRELLALELHYRRQRGERPTVDEYRSRFREHGPLIDALLGANARTGSAPATQASNPAAAMAIPAPDSQVDPGDTLESPPSPRQKKGPTGATGAADWPTIPGYEILDELGHGAMGVVYKARQFKPPRLVALKMVLSGAHASEQELARFVAEAEAVARLQHPNIVQVHEVGEHNGQPFFSMEHCPGGSLAQKLNGTPLPAAQAARLVEVLAHALHAAHQTHVIHRDLKPANVLLVPSERPEAVMLGAAPGPVQRFEPKVTDFGLAKRLDVEGGAATQSGAIIGTPSYMAPEQARGSMKEIGPPTDVYALGAVLYECLTGRPPFKAATPVDTILEVLGDEPVPPRRLNAKVPRDLETVCLMCLRKEAARRYGTAQKLADDLRRFLDRRPVEARPVGSWERSVKWARRRPAVAALVAVSALAVIGGLAAAGTLWHNAEARAATVRQLGAAQEELTDRQARLAALEVDLDDHRRRLDTLQKDLEAEITTKEADIATKQVRLRELGENIRGAEKAARRALYIRDMQMAQTAEEAGPPDRVLMLLGRFFPRDGQPDVRGFEWRYLWGLYHRERAQLRGHTSYVTGAEFAPGGDQLVTVAGEGGMRIWDPSCGKELFPPTAEADGVTAATYAAGGRLLVAGCKDRIVRAWDRPGAGGLGAPRWSFRAHSKAVLAVAVSPDGQVLATGSEDGGVALWKWEGAPADAPPTLQRRPAGYGQAVHGAAVYHVVFSPDCKTLATVGADQTGRLWDVATGKLLRTSVGDNGASVTRVVFSPKGDLVAVAEAHPFQPQLTDSVRLLDASNFQLRLSFGVKGGGWGIDFSPDGELFACASNWGVVRVVQLSSGQTTDVMHAHTGRIHALAFSPDGRTLVTGAADSIAKLWDVARRPDPLLTAHPGGASAVAFSPDGRRLASGGDNGLVRLWDPTTRALLADLPGHVGRVPALAFSPDGRWLASAGADRTVRLWDTAAKTEPTVLRGHTDLVSTVKFSPDGHTIISGSRDGTVRFWDMPGTGDREVVSPRQTLTRTHPQDQVWGVAFSPDGATLAVGWFQYGVTLYDASSGMGRTLLTASHPAAEGTGRVAFSPDGRQVAAGTWLSTVEVWDVASGKRAQPFEGHTGPVIDIAYSPDGQTLFSASRDGTIKLWDVATGLERFTLKGHTSEVLGLALTADGRLLATASLDGSVRLWPAPAPADGPE